MSSIKERIKVYAVAIILVQLLILVGSTAIFDAKFSYIAMVFTLVDAVVIGGIIAFYEMHLKSREISIQRILGKEAKDALEYGKTGIIIYDDDYVISWTSDMFDSLNTHLIGEKMTKVIPGSEVLFNGTTDKALFEIDGHKFEFVRNDTEQLFLVKDVTESLELSQKYHNEKVVLGIVHLDNYDETIQYEDEQKIALINSNIRQKVIEYARSYDGVIRRMRSDRLLVVLNWENFEKMLADQFSILEEIKQQADNIDVAITASMGFAYGSDSLLELDGQVSDLIELVMSRGGDQVAVKEMGQEVKFYGNSSEGLEKSSKVKARVSAQTISGIIKSSDNLFVVPHKDADFDAIGACLGMAAIAESYHKEVYVVLRDISIEVKASTIINRYHNDLMTRYHFVSEEVAVQMLRPNSTVIVCDHHSLDLTSAQRLVTLAKRVVVIDHHRRKAETNINAMMVYNEPTASSTVELVSELIQYQPVKIELNEIDATIMYTGLVVDTDNLKARCSSRTFEACANLKKDGANLALCNEWLKDSLDDFIVRQRILKYVESINNEILIAALADDEPIVSRTDISKVANYMISLGEIKAGFVIGRVSESDWAISARSNGDFNVQIILENMGGGGHFNAAGLQKHDSSALALRKQLLECINDYLQKEANQ